jgi:hypothetical protein
MRKWRAMCAIAREARARKRDLIDEVEGVPRRDDFLACARGVERLLLYFIAEETL